MAIQEERRSRSGVVRHRVVGGALAVAGFTACGPGGDTRSALRLEQLAGVGWAAVWSDTSIGEHQAIDAASVVGGVILGDSAIAVASVSERSIAHIDLRSGTVRWQGRDGGGPGEYRTPHRIRRCGSQGLAVQDFQNGRITFLAPTLSLQGIATVPPALMAGDVVACGEQRSLIIVNDPPVVPGDGVHVVRQVASALAPGFTSWRALGEWQLTEMVFNLRHQVLFPRLLGERAIVAAHGEALYMVHSHRCEVTRFRSGGSPALRVTLAASTRAASSAALAEARERLLAEIADTTVRRSIALALTEVAPGTRMPCVDQAVAASNADLWLGLQEEPAHSSRRWVVLDESLRPRFRISLPQAMRLVDVDGARLLVTEAAGGEERLHVLRLCRAEDPPCDSSPDR